MNIGVVVVIMGVAVTVLAVGAAMRGCGRRPRSVQRARSDLATGILNKRRAR